MAEMEQFEARLAASLGRLADEVPVTVDAQILTTAIKSAEADRSWLRPRFGARALPRAELLRYALVAAALLLLAAAAAVLAPRPADPFDATIHGQMTCAGPAWTSSAAGPVVLECVPQLPDARLAGSVLVTLGEPSESSGGMVRSGSMRLSGDGARWTGIIQITTAPNEAAFGDGWLEGDGAADGQVLYLHLMSSDGLTWGLLGTTGSGGGGSQDRSDD